MWWKVLTLASAAAFLIIALLAVRRAGNSRLAIPLGLTSVGLFAYNMLELVDALTGDHRWLTLAYAVAPLTAIFALSLVVGFIGLHQRWRKLRWAAMVYFSVVAATTVASLFVAQLANFAGSTAWAIAMLAGLLPSFGVASYGLWRHARSSPAHERVRCQLLAGALLLGVGSVMSDLVAIAGMQLPRLSAAGLVLSALLVAALVWRTPILDRPTASGAINATIVGLVAVLAQALVFQWFGSQPALLLMATLAVVLALLAVVRPRLAAMTEQRERTTQLATLGRFTQQMAHDIRNPLATISGAAQFLKEEHNQGRPLAPHAAYVELILEYAQRIDHVVADYRRLGRIEPQTADLDIHALLREATSAASLDDDSIQTQLQLADSAAQVHADRELLLTAIENLLRNAREAMPDGGEIHVSCQRETTPLGEMMRIEIADTGVGMDVRTQEKALDDFFTTKAQGTGLGLAFVARVAEAHGGSCRLHSREGEGTRVQLDVPLAAPQPPAI